ncbi:hypothetical protein PYH72_07970 [Staphylococcus delphini]|uniref:hypothetical protein n=1 Tax=Staphylococcus delphini TaxID=53344 RepID=UPI003364BF8E
MNKYVVSYDLNKEGQNYSELIKLLKSFPDYIHIQKSYWFIKSNQQLKTISEQIDSILDSNDEYLILEFDSYPVGKVSDEVYSDLKRFLS